MMKNRFRYLLIFLIFIVSGVVYIDRSNMSIAGLYLAKDYHIGKIQLGWVQSAFLLGYAFFQIPAGWLVGKLGPRRTLTFGLVWWSALTVATALVPPNMAGALWALIAVRFVLGLGESVAYPSSNQFIAAWFPSAERGIANGWVFGGVGLGSGLAPPLVALIIYYYGWHSVFWCSAALGLVIAVIWYMSARDTPAEHSAVLPAELAHIRAGQREKIEGPIGKVPWGHIFSSVDVWMVTLAYVAFCYVAFIFHTSFFIYLKEGRGLDLKSSAGYSMLPFIAMTLGSLGGGWISDKLVKNKGQYFGRSYWGAFTLLLTAALLVAGSRAENTTLVVLLLAAAAGACYLGQAAYWAVAADIAGPYTGVVSGILNMGGQIAGAVTASATPYLAQEYGWPMAFYVAAGISVLLAFCWFLVNANRRLPHPQAEQVIA